MPALAQSIALVFLGCGINNIALELLVKADPAIGKSITALQFLFITLISFLSRLSLTSGNVEFEKRHLPIWFHIRVTLVFACVSIINNIVFMFNISLPFHMVFRSCSLVVSMVLGLFYFQKSYSKFQIISCLLITAGVLIVTLADSLVQAQCCEISPGLNGSKQQSNMGFTGMIPWLIGVSLLLAALVLSSILGHWQESGYRQYGRFPEECLFYSHFFSLPLFMFAFTDIISQLHSLFNRESNIIVPFVEIVVPYSFIMFINIVSQYICIKAVYTITCVSTTLTCTFALTVRKFASLLISALFMGNDLTAYHWAGAALVFSGSMLYGFQWPSFKSVRVKSD